MPISKLKAATLTFFLLSKTFAMADGQISPVRHEATSNYPNVGLIAYKGIGTCTGTLLRHGLLVTARHCFTHRVISARTNAAKRDPSINVPLESEVRSDDVVMGSWEIRFPENNRVDQTENGKYFSIQEKDGIKIRFDEGINDIAYVTYDPDHSFGKIELREITPALEQAFDPNAPVVTVGFPAPIKTDDPAIVQAFYKNPWFVKLETNPCELTGRTGYFEPKPADPGYEGLLFDTSCPGWFAASGAPYFIEKDGKLEILGVLSHTFAVDKQGEVLNNLIEEDLYGPYVKSTMFSPLYLSKSLKTLINSQM